MDQEKINLTPVGKLFFASLLGWVLYDTKMNWKLKGDKDKIESFIKAVIASKDYQDILKKENKTVEEVMQKLNDKIGAAKEFETKTNIPWLL